MKKITSLLLAILLLLQSALVFAETTSYPYDTVGYFVEKAEFVGDSQIEATITYTSHYGSTANFHTVSYLAVYNNETGKLLEVASQNIDLLKPFQYAGRVTLKQTINVSKTAANVFSVKAIMIEGLTSLRPNCPVPYMANEIIITPLNSRIPLVTAEAIIPEYDLDKTQNSIHLQDLCIYETPTSLGWSADDFNYILKGNVDIKDYIGYLCMIEIDVSDILAPKLYSITKKAGKNIETIIDASLFVDTNMTASGYATYYKTPLDDKTSKLALEGLTIYNNLVKSTYLQVNYTSGDVSYKFVDTDVNGRYDTVFVTNEKSFVIGSVNTTTNKIFRETTNPNAMYTYGVASILLNPLDDAVSWSLKDTNGNNLALADLKAGQVLNVKISEDGYFTFYDILITDTKIEGTITEVYTEARKVGTGTDIYYKIGEKSYRAVSTVALNPGDSIVATLNNQGEIIMYTMSNSMLKYGVVTGTDIIYSFGVIAKVHLMKQTGEIAILNLAKNVMVNGVYKTTATDFDTIAEMSAVLAKGALFIYETNTAGEIKAIYTNTAGIQSKDAAMRFAFVSDMYSAASSKLGTNYILDSSLIYAVKTATLDDEQGLALANKSIFVDEEIYSGQAIVNNGEIQAVILFNASYMAKADSFPLVVTAVEEVTVNGNVRTKLKGLVNGVTREYIGEQDLILDTVGVNDAIQFALNPNNEIANYNKLTDYTATAFIATDNGNLGGTALDDNKFPVSGKSVTLNLATSVAPSTIAPNAVYTVGNIMPPIKGFAASGRAYELRGNVLRLVNKTYDNVCATNGAKDYNNGTIIDGDISDFIIDTSAVAYVYNGITKTTKATTIADLETDKKTGDYITNGRENDDLVYVYKYNGTTYMILIVDTAGDSDMSVVMPSYLVDGEYAFSVGSVSAASNKLYRNVESPNAQTNLTSAMVYLAPNITTIKNQTGATITINDINPLDIINLSVTTVSGNKKYNVVVNKTVVTGAVTEKTATTYMINNISYSMFNAAFSLQVGVSYTIYLDKNNKIVDFTPILGTNNYGIISAVDVDAVLGTIFQVQIMNERGEIKILDLAPTVTVNGTTKTYSTISALMADLVAGSLFIYELNSNGAIKAIYTTTAGIQTKDSAMRFVSVADIYNSALGKLGSNYVLDSSLIYATKAPFFGSYQELRLLNKTLFDNGESYTGTAIVKNGEIKAVILMGAADVVKANTHPLVVTAKSTISIDGMIRIKLKGFVNGIEREYICEEDLYVDDIQVNDVIQFALSLKREISNYTKLADYTSNAFIVSDNGNLGGVAKDDTVFSSAGKTVSLNLYTYPIQSPSSVYTIGATTAAFKGFSACGRAYETGGNTLRLINNYPATFSGYNRYYGYNDSYISDFYINSSAVAYKYNGLTRKISIATIADLETDKLTNDCYSTYIENDDLVYVYNYDGETYMILIIDNLGDN